jgi:ABC-2 type transport system ATP-binding protein
MTPTIRLRGLTKRFGSTTALAGIDLDVQAGEIFGYVGRNGAGKTTTIRVLCGMTDDFEGQVTVCGHDVRTEALAVKRRIGYVPETAALWDELTAMEFLRFVGTLHGLGDAVSDERGRTLLDCFGLTGEADARLGTFSKGMRQKVLISGALLHDPEMLVLDEPLSGLDAHAVLIVKEVLTRLARAGKTIFYSSHVLDVVERVCDRIALIDAGRIVALGTFEELQARARGGSLERIVTDLTNPGEHAAAAARIVAAIHPAGRP